MLLELAKRGENRAFAEIINRYRSPMFFDGVDVTFYNYGGNFTGTIDAPDRPLYIGNTNNEGTWAAMGYFDAIGIWHRVTTAGEKTKLGTSTYPFQ